MYVPDWHIEKRERLKRYFQSDSLVQAVALFGSGKQDSLLRDDWSDLDVLIVIKEDFLQNYFPNLNWASEFGEIYAFEQSTGRHSSVSRCCFRDGSKIDFIFTELDSTKLGAERSQFPWRDGCEVLFANTETLRILLEASFPPPIPPLMNEEEFAKMTNSFRFKALSAVNKIARNDLLIAMHLVLELIQDCCVLTMIIRDRAEGTNCHRTGGVGNDFAAGLQPLNIECTPIGLLTEIERLLPRYDQLAILWSQDYVSDFEPLSHSIAKGLETVSA